MAAKRKAETAPQEPVCVIDGCDNPVFVRGFCQQHWEDPHPVDSE
jgi:hypothetical protein